MDIITCHQLRLARHVQGGAARQERVWSGSMAEEAYLHSAPEGGEQADDKHRSFKPTFIETLVISQCETILQRRQEHQRMA